MGQKTADVPCNSINTILVQIGRVLLEQISRSSLSTVLQFALGSDMEVCKTGFLQG